MPLYVLSTLVAAVLYQQLGPLFHSIVCTGTLHAHEHMKLHKSGAKTIWLITIMHYHVVPGLVGLSCM